MSYSIKWCEKLTKWVTVLSQLLLHLSFSLAVPAKREQKGGCRIMDKRVTGECKSILDSTVLESVKEF
jgi:hypothetical protein